MIEINIRLEFVYRLDEWLISNLLNPYLYNFKIRHSFSFYGIFLSTNHFIGALKFNSINNQHKYLY